MSTICRGIRGKYYGCTQDVSLEQIIDHSVILLANKKIKGKFLSSEYNSNLKSF